MILSHQNKFIFFKPMKVAGSSVEVSLGKHCGPGDILTGTDHGDEKLSGDFDYPTRNNQIEILCDGDIAVKHLLESGYSHLIHKDIEKNKVSIIKPIFHMHTTPVQVLNISELKDLFNEYYTFTIVRNPWDVMVSFFWWSFYHSPTVRLRSDGEVISTENPRHFSLKVKSHLAPAKDDDIESLRRKFQGFLCTYADFQGPYGLDKNCNILKWFSRINSEFYGDDTPLDFSMRYENLQLDYERACDHLKISPEKLPRLKSKQRKKKINYAEYYSNDTREMVASAFDPWIRKFDYRFLD